MSEPQLDMQASFEPGETKDVQVEAPEAIQYNTVLIDTPDDFTICRFTVDGKSQFVTDTEMPAVVFRDRLEIRLSLDKIAQGTPIVLRMRNESNEPRDFRAHLLLLPRSL